METPLTQNIDSSREPLGLEQYQAAGGYAGLRAALAMKPHDVQEQVRRANLKGRGGAGFSTGLKWSFMPMGPDAPRPKYLLVNADEMEPGTFKDRLLLEGDPHQMIEGTLASAYAVGAETAYIFVRGEYHLATHRLRRAIDEAHKANLVGRNILGSNFSCQVLMHSSAGRYMCGEETGLINAMEGRRAQPRSKPPHPQTVGLWGQPSVVNNVETICNVHHIAARGYEWFKGLSHSDDGGTKLYGVSGRVKNPGLWELPMGTTLGEIINGHAGGMQDGYRLRGLLPGGASTPFMLPEHMDVRMDFGHPMRVGSRLGTGTMIVLDDKTCPVGFVHNLMRFFAVQSCGWCTPCREGLPWLERTLAAMEAGNGTQQDMDILDMHVRTIRPGHTFCALAPGAIDPLESALKYFRDDFERHVREKRCPWK